MRRLALALAALLCTVLVLAALLLFIALRALTPASGEWRHVVQIGPWQRELSVPALIRVATHPLAASLIDGRSIDTSAGRWQLRARSDGRFEADCAPCSLRLRALGSAPLTLARAHLQARRAGADRFDGTLWLGEGAHSVALAWRAHLTANGLVLDATLKDAPAAELVHVFGHDIPEAQR
ncbi:MAG: glycosyl transferase, partial [Betaproteobacteria bacterium]